jgi:hypothetical protein
MPDGRSTIQREEIQNIIKDLQTRHAEVIQLTEQLKSIHTELETVRHTADLVYDRVIVGNGQSPSLYARVYSNIRELETLREDFEADQERRRARDRDQQRWWWGLLAAVLAALVLQVLTALPKLVHGLQTGKVGP